MLLRGQCEGSEGRLGALPLLRLGTPGPTVKFVTRGLLKFAYGH